jgi:hypothetical protein
MVALSTTQPFHIIESDLRERYNKFADNDSCGVSKKTCSIYYYLIIKENKNINIYHYKPKEFKIWNVTSNSLGLEKVIELLEKIIHTFVDGVFVSISSFKFASNLSRSAIFLHGAPIISTKKCSHLLQQKPLGNNHCPTQDNNQLLAFTKTTIDKIIISQSDGCFLKVALASASNTKSWIQQIKSTFETCKRVHVLSLYPMFTDPLWTNNSSNTQRA